jgi:hypothetical protein
LPRWAKPADSSGELSIINRIYLRSDGSLSWNGSRASQAEVAQLSQRITTMSPRPFTIVEVEDGADCGRVSVIRKLIDQQAKCREFPSGYYPICGEGKGFVPDPEVAP